MEGLGPRCFCFVLNWGLSSAPGSSSLTQRSQQSDDSLCPASGVGRRSPGSPGLQAGPWPLASAPPPRPPVQRRRGGGGVHRRGGHGSVTTLIFCGDVAFIRSFRRPPRFPSRVPSTSELVLGRAPQSSAHSPSFQAAFPFRLLNPGSQKPQPLGSPGFQPWISPEVSRSLQRAVFRASSAFESLELFPFHR